MKQNPVQIPAGMKDGYIPAPYVLEEGERINDFYLEPVLFHNENGPTIGVTTCGVIVKDGLFFKDMDNDGVLSPYEDWRLSAEERAEDLLSQMDATQKAAQYFGKVNDHLQHLAGEIWREKQALQVRLTRIQSTLI